MAVESTDTSRCLSVTTPTPVPLTLPVVLGRGETRLSKHSRIEIAVGSLVPPEARGSTAVRLVVTL